MRVQHNIPALNAYRNYNNNATGLNKNLEKLSSGYKINRAGDDAAGLAISEKMRAQITGLEVAQKNAKDGISLVQTAEGALTEVQDMLNRMYKLAEQSANGTYSDDVDRVQLQKEVGKLRDEIDRIATTANFNGSKLLDGTLAGSGNGTTSTNGTTGTNGTSSANGTTTVTVSATVASDDTTGVTVSNFSGSDAELDGKTLTASLTKMGTAETPALILDGVPEGYTATVAAKDSDKSGNVRQNPTTGQYAALSSAETVVVTLTKDSDSSEAAKFELDLTSMTVPDDGSGFSMTFSSEETATNGSITTTTKSVTTAMGSQKVTSFNIDGGLVLWVGAEADKANALDVTIDSVKTSALAIDSIDISTQQGGLNALGYIEAAINKVSDIRGGLGATQNRLEHTINNLSVMQENMQDAESTIRDTDVAEEMMKYTKNSILVQSAQAMLAQANQLPQGVLQLLQ